MIQYQLKQNKNQKVAIQDYPTLPFSCRDWEETRLSLSHHFRYESRPSCHPPKDLHTCNHQTTCRQCTTSIFASNVRKTMIEAPLSIADIPFFFPLDRTGASCLYDYVKPQTAFTFNLPSSFILHVFEKYCYLTLSQKLSGYRIFATATPLSPFIKLILSHLFTDFN